MVELYQIDAYELMQKELKTKDKKIKELKTNLHQANIDKEKYFIEAEELDREVKKLEKKIEQMDIEIGDKGDQIASFMTDKLKQNQFEVVAGGIADYELDYGDYPCKWKIGNKSEYDILYNAIYKRKGKNIQIGVKVV